MLVMIALGFALMQTTTNCSTIGNHTMCTTDDPDHGTDSFIEGLRGVQRSQSPTQPIESPNARIEREVGALIAKGDCVGARRLAVYYNVGATIRAVDRACSAPAASSAPKP